MRRVKNLIIKKSNEDQLEDFFYQTKKNEIEFDWKINENKFSKKN